VLPGLHGQPLRVAPDLLLEARRDRLLDVLLFEPDEVVNRADTPTLD
jgi:hypothetical protein